MMIQDGKDGNPMLTTAVNFAILEAIHGELDARDTELADLHEELKHKIGEARQEGDTLGAILFGKLAVVVRRDIRQTAILRRAVADWQDEIVDDLKRLNGEFDFDDDDKQNKPAIERAS